MVWEVPAGRRLGRRGPGRDDRRRPRRASPCRRSRRRARCASASRPSRSTTRPTPRTSARSWPSSPAPTSTRSASTPVGPSWGEEISRKALRALVFFLIAHHDLHLVPLRAADGHPHARRPHPRRADHDRRVLARRVRGDPGHRDRRCSRSSASRSTTASSCSTRSTRTPSSSASSNSMTYSDMVDLSLNQVLMRSLNTSITALLPVASLLVLGSFVLGATTLAGVRPRPAHRPLRRRLLVDLHRLAAARGPEGARAALPRRPPTGSPSDRRRPRPPRRVAPAAGGDRRTATTVRPTRRAGRAGAVGPGHPAAAPQEGQEALAPRSVAWADVDRRVLAAGPPARRPRLPASRGSPSRTSPRCWPTSTRSASRSTPSPTPGRAPTSTRVAGIEARGFLLAAPVAYRLGAGADPDPQAGQAAVGGRGAALRARVRRRRRAGPPRRGRARATGCC